LPLFTGAPSETFRKVPDRVQIDNTLHRQNRIQNMLLNPGPRGLAGQQGFTNDRVEHLVMR
jgi:hypothetical protein